MRLIRTQVQLGEGQLRRLKALAAERDVSVAALVREAVDRLLEEGGRDARWDRALALVGRFREPDGGARDVAEAHDRYLDEAYGS